MSYSRTRNYIESHFMFGILAVANMLGLWLLKTSYLVEHGISIIYLSSLFLLFLKLRELY